MHSTSTARRLLRAVHVVSQREGSSLRTLLALVPDPPARACAMLLALDEAGYIDGERLRLTLRGFAALHAPQALAFERRRGARLRKAIRVA
ncbi:MAG: hypothetical protein NVS3B10_21050 [Polyangiales bacterium]